MRKPKPAIEGAEREVSAPARNDDVEREVAGPARNDDIERGGVAPDHDIERGGATPDRDEDALEPGPQHRAWEAHPDGVE